MFFKVPNSSFILDLRLLSMILCAVFLAVFFTAAVVAEFVLLCVAFLLSALSAIVCLDLLLVSGFICIILLDLVGGGGSVEWSVMVGSCCVCGSSS